MTACACADPCKDSCCLPALKCRLALECRLSSPFAMHDDLTIDRNVRDWVFFPLMLLIILMNVLRQMVHQARSSTQLLNDA